MPFPLDALHPWNTHWSGDRVSALVLHHPGERAAVPFLARNLLQPPSGQWEVVAGPRQIGKTTSLGHVAERLLRVGVPPRSVAVVPFDQPAVQSSLEGGLDGLIDGLATNHPPRREAPLFLLLDEVQELPDWSRRLKAAWDRHHGAVRVLATGSSALRLVRPVEADFPGRIRIQTMHPMKFREVLLQHPDAPKHASPAAWEAIVAAARAARVSVAGPPGVFRTALESLDTLLRSENTVPGFARAVFREYCIWGGYPAARPGTDRSLSGRREVFEQAWNAVLGRDLPAVGVVKAREFTLLFQHLALNPGGKFVPHNLAKRLGVRADTVSQWKRVMEDVLVLQQLPGLKPSLQPGPGKDKVYLMDPGWYGYLAAVTDHSTVPGPVLGLLAETVLVDHVRRLQYGLFGTSTLPIGYVDRPEVDVAASLGDRWLRVESKFRVRTRKGTGAIEAGGKVALDVYATEDRFRLAAGAGPHEIPAWEWALIC